MPAAAVALKDMSRGLVRDPDPGSTAPARPGRGRLRLAAFGTLGALALGAALVASTSGGHLQLGPDASPWLRLLGARAEAQPEPVPSETLLTFVEAKATDVQEFWARDFESRNQAFAAAEVIVHPPAQTASCGAEPRAVGTFYCGTAHEAHFDLPLYRALGAHCPADANAAEAYVIAHSLAHHVQSTLKLDAMVSELAKVHKGQGHALGVRMELQADCFAGVWSRRSKAAAPLSIQNIEAAQRCVSEVSLERKDERPAAAGDSGSENFSHASARQRAYWFAQGYNSGQIQSCDSFAPAQP
jgi:uncharacterized protein